MKRASPPPTEDNKSSLDICTKKKHREFENLKSLLDCSVCFTLVRPGEDGIFTCQNSHLVCQECLVELKFHSGMYNFKCPVCRIPWKSCKNLFASHYLDIEYRTTPVECKYECKHKDLLAQLKTHELFCFQRKVRCPSALSQLCDWRGEISKLSDHIKEKGCCRLVFDYKDRPLEENEISFRGQLNNSNGVSVFHDRESKALKPVVLLSGNVFRMYCFLQVERSCQGRWCFSVWSLLPEEALQNCKANICLRTVDSKFFVAQLRILSQHSLTRGEGLATGNCLMLFDEQLRKRGREPQRKIFDFKVTLITSKEFRGNLNGDSETPAHLDFLTDVACNPNSTCVLINAPAEIIETRNDDVRVEGAENDQAQQTMPAAVDPRNESEDDSYTLFEVVQVRSQIVPLDGDDTLLHRVSSELEYPYQRESPNSPADHTGDEIPDLEDS